MTPMVQNVCAKAPPGVDSYADMLIGWAKYGVLALIVAAGFVSVGSMIVGKLGGMSRTAQFGASGLLWTVLAAVAYVTIYGVITAIIGQGC